MPSAPIILVAAAVVLIAVATDLSGAGVHPSLPAAITLPAPEQAPAAPGADPTGQARTTPSTAARAEMPTATTSPVPPPYHEPTAVAPSYPLGSPRSSGSGDSSGGRTPTVTAASSGQDGTSAQSVPGASSSGGTEDGNPDSSGSSTETVTPNYPVVTSAPTSTTTTVPTSTTTDR